MLSKSGGSNLHPLGILLQVTIADFPGEICYFCLFSIKRRKTRGKPLFLPACQRYLVGFTGVGFQCSVNKAIFIDLCSITLLAPEIFFRMCHMKERGPSYSCLDTSLFTTEKATSSTFVFITGLSKQFLITF